jgi:ESCRT-I complex subunit VPS28
VCLQHVLCSRLIRPLLARVCVFVCLCVVVCQVLHGGSGASAKGGSGLHVFHAVQHFITAMDSLKLGMKAVDELHPNMSDLMDSVNKVVRTHAQDTHCQSAASPAVVLNTDCAVVPLCVLSLQATLPAEHESKTKVREWLLRLGSMKAHDELSAEQVRQMSFDLENAYNAFHRFVEQNKDK